MMILCRMKLPSVHNMCDQIKKNFFFAVSVGGIVVANYYANSLAAIPSLKERYPGCEVEVFDVSKYGFSFGEAPVIKVEGVAMRAIKCKETGKVWRSAKQCCAEVRIPLKSLYTAIYRGSRIFGYHYEYCEIKNENEL